MTVFLFKLFTTPTLILFATVASRRFGQAIGGWLVGLPLTSGPIAVFLAVENGARFAQHAALGSLEGTVAQACFATTYARLAQRSRWPISLSGAAVAFAIAGLLLMRFQLPMPLVVAIACASLAAGQKLVGKPKTSAAPASAPKWDLPLRMVVATSLVLVVTSVANDLGPSLSGLAATFPLFAIVLVVFAHQQQGAAAVRGVMRGLMLGLYGVVGFFSAVSLLVARIGLASAFAVALAVNLLIHGATLVVLRRGHVR